MLCSPNPDWFPCVFPSPSDSLAPLFSPLCRGPGPAEHISKWQLLRLSLKKNQVVDFPRLMWHRSLCNRNRGGKVGPCRTMAVCLSDGREGVKNQIVEDISSQQIDTGPLILSFSFPSSWTWSALQMAVVSQWPFLKSEKIGGWARVGWGNQGFPQHTGHLHSITLHPSAALLLRLLPDS